MNIRYKLLNKNNTSRNNTYWVLNEWKETDGTGELCSSGWLHCYSDPLLAIILNPIHASTFDPLLYKCEVEGKHLDDKGLKEGWTRMRIIEQIEIPEISIIQKIAFGILCSMEVYKEDKYLEWANSWLSGNDRSNESATTSISNTYADGYNSFSADYAAYAISKSASVYANSNIYLFTDSISYYIASSVSASASAYNHANSAKLINLQEIIKKAMEVK